MQIHKPIQQLAVPIESVKPYDGNPRRGSVESLVESLRANGQYRPIVVNRYDSQILAGNHTWEAAKQLGWDTIAVTYVDVSEEQARRIVLADNRLSDVAEYNDDSLGQILQSIFEDKGSQGFWGTGYSNDAAQEILHNLSVSHAADFLDDLAAADKDVNNRGKSDSESLKVDSDWVTVSYVLLPEDRDVVFSAVRLARAKVAASSNSEAIVEVCAQYIKEQE